MVVTFALRKENLQLKTHSSHLHCTIWNIYNTIFQNWILSGSKAWQR